MYRQFRTLTVVFALVSGATCAETSEPLFKAPNDYRVTASRIEGAEIQVFPYPPAHGRGYFCAAADYAVRFLGARTTDRLLIVVPEMPRTGPRDPKSVHFAVVPRSEAPELPGSQGAVDPRKAGENRNIGGAHQFCFRSKRMKNDL